MIKYQLKESQDGSLFIVTSKKENIYGLHFQSKDIEVRDFDDDFLQDKMVELFIAKFTGNDATHIKYVVETCCEIFLEVINGKFQENIIYFSVKSGCCKAKLLERLMLMNDPGNIAYLRIKNVGGQSFYFVFNEHYTSTVTVINALIDYFKKEYGVNLTTSSKG